ncbi:MAG TPA: SRPBCC family protein [Geobacteraceae bacterium]
MPTIEQKIHINAPLAKVYTFITTAANWTEYVTSLTEVSNVSSPGLEPGTTYSWEYRMLGVKLTGTGRVTENVFQQSFGMHMEGTIPISEHYTLSEKDGGTDLAIRINYQMPVKVLEKIANSKLVEKLNMREAESVLEKIKLLCEEL